MGEAATSNNDLVGGVPVGKYFELGKFVGRGGTYYLFMLANDIRFEEADRVPVDDHWPVVKQQLIDSGENPAGQLPLLKLNGKILTGHLPIARYLSRKIGMYGSDAEADYEADQVAGEYQTWRDAWASDFMGGNEATRKHYLQTRESHYKLLEHFYGKHEGPFYSHTKTPNFPDVAVFGILCDDQAYFGDVDLERFPHLKALWDACLAIPKVKKWLQGKGRIN